MTCENFCLTPPNAHRRRLRRVRQLPIYCVQSEEKVVALTFDAAWGNEDTQQLIDILGQYNVPATFFLVGDWVDNYPESVKALSDAGHSVQNHSNTHPYLTQCSADTIMSELNACNDKIEAITGVRPTLIRPPYGDYNDTVVNTIRSMGMEPIQWDVERSHTEESPYPSRESAISLPGGRFQIDCTPMMCYHNAC